MSERQKQHLGRSKGDETMLEGRDIRADAPDGIGAERVSGGEDSGTEARHPKRAIPDSHEPCR